MLVAASVIATTAMALSIAPAFAQTSPAKPASSAAAADASKLVRADRSMLVDLAEGNRAEVAAGQLALEKSQNADVKKFAQMMIDDHGKALTEVEALAQSKDTKLPDGVGAVHKTKEVALKALSGKTFDSQYAKRAGVGDHESTVKLLKKIQAEAKDADLKALADKMLPTVEHHLEMAKQLAAMK
ncbi:hypothetical protein RD110_19440 [Rhodoferax koreense]|uniref:DUF4142 domain-containing protein n=2 Tax=Rhodoferax koreensis TaxID=1842727 RepID=A0A1P8JZD3_9BURK|nr:hypothetical protein RD110_19440 [Rhodoferax koreense]